MQDHHFETTLEQADQLLRFAEDEFYRPQEDIVLDQLGRHIQKATAHYLAAFLIRHAREVRPSMPIPHLMQLCAELEPKFKTIEMVPILVDEPYQLNVADINQALKYAKKIREMTRLKSN